MVGKSCYISVTPEFIDSCIKSGELYFSHIHVNNKLIDSKSCRFKVKFGIDLGTVVLVGTNAKSKRGYDLLD